MNVSFLGGKLGSGKQFFTWIHEEDFLNAALWTIKNEHAIGAFNLTSPEPVSNDDFMKALGRALGIPFIFRCLSGYSKSAGKLLALNLILFSIVEELSRPGWSMLVLNFNIRILSRL